MSIELRGITKSFGEATVVRGMDLRIATGELCVLLGPSGSGKSTLLRIVAGLEEPDDGQVLLHGEDVTHADPRRRGIGFVFQHYALFRHLTVAENVEFPLRVRLLQLLLAQAGRTVTPERLIRHLWGGSLSAGREHLKQLVYRLRHKIEDDPMAPRLLRTDPGAGYRLEP